MKLTRMHAGLSDAEKLLFCATKFALIQSELNALSNHWGKCQVDNIKVVTTNAGDPVSIDVTCNKAGVELCDTCEMNQIVYKEKRKLKAQLSKASAQLVKHSKNNRCYPACVKLESTLTDQLNKLAEKYNNE